MQTKTNLKRHWRTHCKYSQRIWWHICIFLQRTDQRKKIQKSHQANAPIHRKQWTTEQRQTERQHLTAPTQKAGFRVPKTVLWLNKH